MTTVTVTMREGYGLYEDQRGVNAPEVTHKSTRYERGGSYYPNSLEEVARSGTELTYAQYASNLDGADCNCLRISLAGWNQDNQQHTDLEPPPYGTYNVWHNLLDPNTLATYRSDQVTYPVDSAKWAASNLKEFLDQCEANNVNLLINPFQHAEFMSGWSRHAWNSANRYVNGELCEVADRGFITNAYEIFDDATAIQAAKDRLTFLINVFSNYSCPVAWEICTELSWLMTPDFWGTEWGSAHINNNIRAKIKPWVVEIAQHIRDTDPYNRPIGCGLLRTPTSGDAWSGDADNYWNVINEPLLQYPLDFVNANMYYEDWQSAVTHWKRCKQKTDKVVWITQMRPSLSRDQLEEETSPFLKSKKLIWIPMCGERWGLTALRWMGLREQSTNYWATGGYADPDYYGIPSVTKFFSGNMDWNSHKPNNYVFDPYLSSAGTDACVSHGDGENVTMLVEWTSGGNKTLNVSNVSNGTYTFTYYDWTDGTIAGTAKPVAAGGSLSVSIDVTDYEDQMIVSHLLKD